MRLFCDANVLFAAAVAPEGRSAALLELASATDHEAVASPHPIEEAARNLRLKRPEALEAFERGVLPKVTPVPEAHPDRVEDAAVHGLPPQDTPILAAAISCGADVLVTGDRRHFGRLFGETIGGVRIVSLRDALSLLSR